MNTQKIDIEQFNFINCLSRNEGVKNSFERDIVEQSKDSECVCL